MNRFQQLPSGKFNGSGVNLLPVSTILILILFLSLIPFLLVSCSDNGVSPEQPGTEDVTNYLQDLPSWSQFSPQGQAQPPIPVGEARTEDDVVIDVEVINDDGNVEMLRDVTYACQVDRKSVV